MSVKSTHSTSTMSAAPAYRLRVLMVGLVLWIAGFMGACEKPNSDPPEFEGLGKSVSISQSQVSLHWNAGQDDRSHVDEIVYAIWVAPEGLDVEAPPQFLTGEGANSFSLIGLDADTEYQILVRAEDRGGNQSDNTEIHTVRSAAQGEGMFAPEQIIALDRQVSSIVVGTIKDGEPRALGTISERRIDWWECDASGQLIGSDVSRITVSENILEGFLVRLRDKTYDDVFLLMATGFIQMNNNGSGDFSSDSGTFFPEIPQVGTVNFAQFDDDEDLDLVYANLLGRIFFYAGDRTGNLSLAGYYDSGVVPQQLQVAELDGEEGVDLILLSEFGLAVILAEDNDFSYGTMTWLSMPTDFSGSFDRLLVEDDDGDGDTDLHLYQRNEGDHLTRMFRYDNDGEGDFDAPDEIDFSSAAYGLRPEAADLDGDGFGDLLVPQPESNNLVVYLGSGTRWSEVAYALGGADAPTWAWIGLLDSDDQNDVVLLSDDSQSMTVLTTQKP